MEQTVKKLKTVDVDYYDKHSNEDNLFFDVIDHRFEDDFLVISRYREYSEDTVMKLFRVPQGDIMQLTRLVNGEQEGSWYEQER